jgi:hypothetical protein
MPEETVQCNACGQATPPRGAFRPCGDLGLEIMCFACVFVYSFNGATCGLCGAEPCMGFVATQASPGAQIRPMAMCPTCISGCQEAADEVTIEGATEGHGRIPMPSSEREN